jgi:hypothetical protein
VEAAMDVDVFRTMLTNEELMLFDPLMGFAKRFHEAQQGGG